MMKTDRRIEAVVAASDLDAMDIGKVVSFYVIPPSGDEPETVSGTLGLLRKSESRVILVIQGWYNPFDLDSEEAVTIHTPGIAHGCLPIVG